MFAALGCLMTVFSSCAKCKYWLIGFIARSLRRKNVWKVVVFVGKEKMENILRPFRKSLAKWLLKRVGSGTWFPVVQVMRIQQRFSRNLWRRLSFVGIDREESNIFHRNRCRIKSQNIAHWPGDEEAVNWGWNITLRRKERVIIFFESMWQLTSPDVINSEDEEILISSWFDTQWRNQNAFRQRAAYLDILKYDMPISGVEFSGVPKGDGLPFLCRPGGWDGGWEWEWDARDGDGRAGVGLRWEVGMRMG